jgi:hypothetical protein
VPCIRIRPTIPQKGGAPAVPPDREPDREELEQKAAAAEGAARMREPGEEG